MGKVHVRLNVIKRIKTQGKPTTFYPGDWVECSKAQAKQWLADGDAEIPRYDLRIKVLDTSFAGVVITNPDLDAAKEAALQVTDAHADLRVQPGVIGDLPYPQTLYWDGQTPLRTDLMPVGFARLHKWQVAAPIYRYKRLAVHMGTEEEREKTAALVGDLRVPLYNPGLVYVRRCEQTQRFVRVWAQELNECGPLHALLRAIFVTRPILCALPMTWTAGA